MKAEVLHWWTSGGESAAVKVFADQFKAAGGTWVDTAIAGGAERAHRRHQPDRRRQSADRDAVQHRQAVRRAGRQRAAAATSTSVAGAGKWRDVLPPAIVEAATRDGKFYAVPVNIHGIELALVQQARCSPTPASPSPRPGPRSWRPAQKLKAAGPDPASPRAASPGRSGRCSTRSWSATAAPTCSTRSTATRTSDAVKGRSSRRSPSCSSSCRPRSIRAAPAATGTTPPPW